MTASPHSLEVYAPLSGVLFPLEIVPDPVFAQKMVGDGVSLDPLSNEVLAPVDGTITQLHHAHHALTITTCEGIELLVHVGVDTVLLKSEGFEPLVALGDKVKRGQALMRFDMDVLALKAPSCLTQIIVTNGDRVACMHAASGEVRAGLDVVLTIDLADTASADAAEPMSLNKGVTVQSDWVTLPNPAGLHARPAAVLAAEARKYLALVKLVRGSEEVNARSIVAIMGLATQYGDRVCIKASGPQGKEAANALVRMLATGCGEAPGVAPAKASAMAGVGATPPLATARADELAGVPASPGIALGRIFQFRQQTFDVRETGGTSEVEQERFRQAIRQAESELRGLIAQQADATRKAILQAHLELLDDPDLIEPAEADIVRGRSAGIAWQAAFTTQAHRLAELHNALLRERAADVRDLGRRVLSHLAVASKQAPVIPDACILIAEELSPSDTAALDRSKVLGFCTTTGGSTSHVAILARSLGIPAVCGIDAAALRLEQGVQVVLDGYRGILQCDPKEEDLIAARARMALHHQRHNAEKAAAHNPAITTDGQHIEVVANVRNAEETREALELGGEGVGLLRSEFLFDNRDTAPSETEQATAYKAVAEVLGPERTLVIRTLDVGGDKPLPYLPLPAEDNPFLGLRGVRVSLARPDIFRTQLRAILHVAPLCKLHIMFPMVASLEELRAAKAILAEEMLAVGIASHDGVKVGMMVEVPSAAAMADVFAAEVDYFSIGTNDLTQYTLAMDRGHPQLAKSADALHPAVLRLIGLTVKGAHKHGKWVGICGGVASDPLAIPVLIGLGVDELSVSVPAIPAVKARIQRLSLAECRELTQEIMHMGTTAEVRERLSAYVQKFE